MTQAKRFVYGAQVHSVANTACNWPQRQLAEIGQPLRVGGCATAQRCDSPLQESASRLRAEDAPSSARKLNFGNGDDTAMVILGPHSRVVSSDEGCV